MAKFVCGTAKMQTNYIRPEKLKVGELAVVRTCSSWQKDWIGLIVMMTDSGLITIGKPGEANYGFRGFGWKTASLAAITVEKLQHDDEVSILV